MDHTHKCPTLIGGGHKRPWGAHLLKSKAEKRIRDLL